MREISLIFVLYVYVSYVVERLPENFRLRLNAGEGLCAPVKTILVAKGFLYVPMWLSVFLGVFASLDIGEVA